MSTNYKALTRIYRPQTFDDIVSQEHVSNTLKNAIEKNRLSHAYLFCGPRGVGKTTMARVLARTINEVDENVDGEALNNTLNIIEIDAASNNSVEDIRTLRERVRIPPQNGRYKVYIIDEIHMLSKSAFNALLKTLEEPPEHVIFIFATTEPHRILPTILSRCQRFDFRRITVDEIVERLDDISRKENIDIDKESLHVIAKKADGALRDALGILDQAIAFCGTTISYEELHRALNIVSLERMFELTDALTHKDTRAGMALLHNLLYIGNDIQEFISALTEHFRNLYLAKDSQNFYLIEATDESKQRFQKTAEGFSEDDLMRMMHIMHEAQFSIRDAQQPRIHLEITLLKLFHMTRSDGLDALLRKLRDLEEKLSAHSGNPDALGKTQSSKKVKAEERTPNTTPSTVQEEKKPSYDHTATRGGYESAPAAPSPDSPERNQDVQGTSNIFGTPTLKQSQNHLKAVSIPGKTNASTGNNEIRGNLALSPKPGPVSEKNHPGTESRLPSRPSMKEAESLDDILGIWSDYLDKLQETASNMLYFTMQKTRPVELAEGIVTLECSDSFTSDIIREHNRKLCDTLREHFGYALRFTSRLVENQKRTDAVHDPYEHFLKLQKKDPKLRQIVDLFGAELEY